MGNPIAAIAAGVSLIQSLQGLTSDDTPNLPAPPEAVEAPKPPNVAKAKDVAADTTGVVKNNQAARRRSRSVEQRLFSLGSDQNTNSILSRTLSGK